MTTVSARIAQGVCRKFRTSPTPSHMTFKNDGNQATIPITSRAFGGLWKSLEDCADTFVRALLSMSVSASAFLLASVSLYPLTRHRVEVFL